MPFGRSRRGRGRRGMPPQPGRRTPRTAINRPGSQTGGTGRCAGITDPRTRDRCMRSQEMQHQMQMQQEQDMDQGNIGVPPGPAPPTGPETEPQYGIGPSRAWGGRRGGGRMGGLGGRNSRRRRGGLGGFARKSRY